MAELTELVKAANLWLKIDEIPDYPQALNGLQLQNSGSVKRVAAAVDASLPVIHEACRRGVDLLVVHHGLFWQGAQKIEGAVYEKLKTAMDHDLAIYSAHIPLDVHPEMGNNARLMGAIGLNRHSEPFFPWKGIDLGLRASVKMSRAALMQRINDATGGQAHLCPGGREEIEEVGLITGGAGSQIYEIAETGIDTFITGEGPHWSFVSAEELGVNLIYAGHYLTETFGVRALAQKWSEAFEDVSFEFIDRPTGL
ncbi:MAG: Nif3-like dinuclear metal center hexameric protein [Verrucomicrobiota bacterium]